MNEKSQWVSRSVRHSKAAGEPHLALSAYLCVLGEIGQVGVFPESLDLLIASASIQPLHCEGLDRAMAEAL
jgi:hypothetical protein